MRNKPENSSGTWKKHFKDVRGKIPVGHKNKRFYHKDSFLPTMAGLFKAASGIGCDIVSQAEVADC